MILTASILGGIALVLFIINIKKGGQHIEGLKVTGVQLSKTILMIIGAFIMAGFIAVLIPEEFVRQWLSTEAGIKGIFLGTIGGIILAMEPYASFPIIFSIYSSGAGLGTTVSMITSWCISGMSKMPYETGLMGVEFYIKKQLFTLPFSIGAGLIAYLLEFIL